MPLAQLLTMKLRESLNEYVQEHTSVHIGTTPEVPSILDQDSLSLYTPDPFSVYDSHHRNICYTSAWRTRLKTVNKKTYWSYDTHAMPL